MTCTVDSGPTEIPRNDTSSNHGNSTNNVNSTSDTSGTGIVGNETVSCATAVSVSDNNTVLAIPSHTDDGAHFPSISPTSSPASPVPIKPQESPLPLTLPTPLPVLVPIEVQGRPHIVDSSPPNLDPHVEADADADIDKGDVYWLSVSRLTQVRAEYVLSLDIFFFAIAIAILAGVYRTLLARRLHFRGQYAAVD
jgi:hypothetical protein